MTGWHYADWWDRLWGKLLWVALVAFALSVAIRLTGRGRGGPS